MKPATQRTRRRFVCVIGIGLGMSVLLLALLDSPSVEAAPVPQPDGQTAGLTTQATHTVYLPFVGRYHDSRIPPFGIQFYGSSLDAVRLDYTLDAGAAWIRWQTSWATVEPVNTTPESYDWSALDASIVTATKRGFHLMLTVGDQPSWAATYAMGPVTDTADLLEFVGALVERYDGDGLDDAPGSPRVLYFELYNEPDNADIDLAIDGGWSYWGHNGSGYAALLQEVYPVVKASNPAAKLVIGGLAMDWFEEHGGPFDSQFLDDVLAACRGHDCFDVMNFHYFPLFRYFWEPYGPDIIGKANYVRQKLAAYGFNDTPVVCTETSHPAADSWGDEELQNRYVVKGYVRGLAARLDIIVWYFVQDGSDPGLPGLLDNSLQPKPSYWAYQNMTAMLAGAYYQRALTSAETGSSRLVGYTFEWCGQRLDVVWTEDITPLDPDDDPVLPLTVRAESVRLVDKLGTEQWLNDEDDGSADGRITLLVGGSPVYLEYHP